MPRVRLALLAGSVSGLAAGLVFATAHALLIVPIWKNRAQYGLTRTAGSIGPKLTGQCGTATFERPGTACSVAAISSGE